jgi:hypothetical protein
MVLFQLMMLGLYVAVMVAADVPIINVVLAAFIFAMPYTSTVHLSNNCPIGGIFAAMGTTVPEA